MPGTSTLARLNMNDILAVVAPGFFVFLSIYIFYATCSHTITLQNQTPCLNFWDIIINFSIIIYDKPSSLLFIIMISYLIGIILRAIPVRTTERIIPPFTSDFPYPAMQNHILDTLKTEKQLSEFQITHLPDKINEFHMHVYNYWKSVLCLRASEGFHYYRSFESRSRFFAGMILASLLSAFPSLVMMIFYKKDTSAFIGLFILSTILLFIFGANFRRIRGQEARELFFVYLAYLHDMENHH